MNRSHRPGPRRGVGAGRERGTAGLELVLVVPLLALLLTVTVALGELVSTHLDVADAAQQAARAASLTRDPGDAQRAAGQAADQALAQAGRYCRDLNVTTDTSSFRPGGSVAVQVGCTTDLGSLGSLIPLSHTSTSSARSPVDTYRSVLDPGGAP
jgi:Flp pilus assembly protein TadG